MTKAKIVSLMLTFIISFGSLYGCQKNTDTDRTPDDIQNNEENENNENIDKDISQNQQTGSETVDIPDIPDDEPIQENEFADETLEQFFENSAFVGDSVMYGMELYANRNNTVESSATFLTLTSFAARHGLSDVTEKSYHPLYNGEKMKVEDALALDGANKVFIFLGLNDVRITPSTYYENYVDFIGKIKEKCPDIKIFIISTTYPVASPHSMDMQTAASYRDQLLDLNTRLREYCESGNGYYVDIIGKLQNENGFLDDKYSSDNYVHLTNSAYGIWAETLETYATSLIETGLPPSESDESQENDSENEEEINNTEDENADQ